MKVYIAQPIQPEGVKMLEQVAEVRSNPEGRPQTRAEFLAYDCRLMNQALATGDARTLRDWLTASDRWLSPQAVILSPEAAWEIAQTIVAEKDDYRRTPRRRPPCPRRHGAPMA